MIVGTKKISFSKIIILIKGEICEYFFDKRRRLITIIVLIEMLLLHLLEYINRFIDVNNTKQLEFNYRFFFYKVYNVHEIITCCYNEDGVS